MSPAMSPSMCARNEFPPVESDSIDDHAPFNGRRAVLIASEPLGPDCQTAVAVPSLATNRSGLPPVAPGICCAPVHGPPGALSAHMILSASDHAAVIRPCGSMPTTGPDASPAPDSCSAADHVPSTDLV